MGIGLTDFPGLHNLAHAGCYHPAGEQADDNICLEHQGYGYQLFYDSLLNFFKYKQKPFH